MYQTMKRYGVKGIIVKVSEGTSYVNPNAKVQIENAHAAGLKVGVYHFSRYSNVDGARREAKYFANQAMQLGITKNDLMVDDLEASETMVGSASVNAAAFKAELAGQGYTNLGLYMYPSFINTVGFNTNIYGPKKMWIASYPYAPSDGNLWYTNYGMWQWNSKTHFPGITGTYDVSIDYNHLLTDSRTTVTDTKDVNILAQMTNPASYGLYAKNPGNVDGAEKTNDASFLKNQYIAVTQTKTTSDGSTFFGFMKDGRMLWVNAVAMTTNPAGVTSLNKTVMFLPSTTTNQKFFNAGPGSVIGATSAGLIADRGQNYKPFYVKQQVDVDGTVWYRGELLDGSSYWIRNYAAVDDNSAPQSADYTASVTDKNSFAYSGTPGEYQTSNLGTTDKFYGKSVRVTTEWTTPDGVTWVGFAWNNQTVYIRKTAVKLISYTDYTQLDAKVVQNGRSDSLYVVPAWYVGSQELKSAQEYNNKIFKVIRTMVDVNGQKWYGAYFGNDFAWIRAEGMRVETSQGKRVDYTATLMSSGKTDTAYQNQPGEFANAINLGTGDKFYGKSVRITKEWTATSGTTWVGFDGNGHTTYMRKSVFNKVSDTDYTSFDFVFNKNSQNAPLYTVPFWYVGSTTTGSVDAYAGQKVTVIRTMKDVNGTVWYGAYLPNGAFVWFDANTGTKF